MYMLASTYSFDHRALHLFDCVEVWCACSGGLELIAEVTVPKATAVAFSTGGHLFAAVGKGSRIVVHNTLTRAPVATLRGHVSTVTALQFNTDDSALMSTSAGGATYFWDLQAQVRCLASSDKFKLWVCVLLTVLYHYVHVRWL
jgi:WD40 repeat protein